MGWEAQRLHLPVKTQCFVHLGISCELGNRKNGTGDRQEAFTCEKPMFCAVWKKISSMHIDVSKRCENIRERDGTNWGVRHAAHPSWYRRWTKYSNPFYPVQPPRPQSSMLL